MRKAMISLFLIVALAGPCFADMQAGGALVHPEYGLTVPVGQTAENECKLGYFNIGSGWVYWWEGFNGTAWADLELPARIGICYDLGDCEDGCAECTNLGGVMWAWKRLTSYGRIDVELYCADEFSCPIGSPLAGFYDYRVDPDNPFQYFSLGDLELPCDGCRFVVMASVKTPGQCLPYSDANDRNRLEGSEVEWRCSSHSYCYRNVVDYCQGKGTPAELTIDYEGACPPDDRFHVEWITYAYVGCRGALTTEQNTWSELKKLYR